MPEIVVRLVIEVPDGTFLTVIGLTLVVCATLCFRSLIKKID